MSVYFNKKDELKEKAVSHYKMMEAGFKNEIEECVKNTKTYGGDGIAVSVDMKLFSPIYSTDDGSSTLLKLSHSAKAESFIHFTPSCIFTDSRFLQLKKSPFPIISILEGISTCIRSLQCANM